MPKRRLKIEIEKEDPDLLLSLAQGVTRNAPTFLGQYWYPVKNRTWSAASRTENEISVSMRGPHTPGIVAISGHGSERTELLRTTGAFLERTENRPAEILWG